MFRVVVRVVFQLSLKELFHAKENVSSRQSVCNDQYSLLNDDDDDDDDDGFLFTRLIFLHPGVVVVVSRAFSLIRASSSLRTLRA